MSRIWRVSVAAAVAVGGLGLGLVGVSPATAARTPAVSITVSSQFMKVSGFTWVYYKPAADNAATVSGTAINVSTGDTVTLYAEPFGAKTLTATGKPVTLTADNLGNASFSFTVHPSRETKYEAEVVTQDSLHAISTAQAIYVTRGFADNHFTQSCRHGHCTASYRFYVEIPASAYKSEFKKHWYLYFAAAANQPATYPLSKTATAKNHKVNAGEFYALFTFRWKTKNPSLATWRFGCIKDTESSNGIGLPGKHGCGNKKLSTTLPYVG
jgi:hypothetical protein